MDVVSRAAELKKPLVESLKNPTAIATRVLDPAPLADPRARIIAFSNILADLHRALPRLETRAEDIQNIRRDVGAATTHRVFEVSEHAPSKLSHRDRRENAAEAGYIDQSRNSIASRLAHPRSSDPEFPTSEQDLFDSIISHIEANENRLTFGNCRMAAEQLSVLVQALNIPSQYLNAIASSSAVRKAMALGLGKPSINYKQWLAKERPRDIVDRIHTAETLALRCLVKDNPPPYKTSGLLKEWNLFEYHFPDLGRVFICSRGAGKEESMVIEFLIGKHVRGESGEWQRRHLASAHQIMTSKNLL